MNNKHYQKAFRFVCQCRHGFERRSEGNHVKRFFNRLRLIGNHFSYSEPAMQLPSLYGHRAALVSKF